MSEFDRFWQAYPKKEGKAAAKKKWADKKLDEKATQIVNHLEVRVKQDKKWLAGYIPMPTTFINQERWEDEYERVAPVRGPNDPAAKPVDPSDPNDTPEAWKGALRAVNINPEGLSQSDCESLLFAKKYGHLMPIHVSQLPDRLKDKLNDHWGPEF